MKVFIIIALALGALVSLGILVVSIIDDEKEIAISSFILLAIFIIAEVFASQITSINQPSHYIFLYRENQYINNKSIIMKKDLFAFLKDRKIFTTSGDKTLREYLTHREVKSENNLRARKPRKKVTKK